MATQLNQSLIQGIACLQVVASSEHPVGSRDLARQVSTNHTRVSRVLSTLAEIGLVEKTPDRKYRPGPGLHVLAAQSIKGSRLLPSALPHLLEMQSEGMTVALGVLWRGQVCYLLHKRPRQTLGEAIARHELYPAERSSLGVALLAASLSPEQASDELREAMARVHREGYAVLHYPNGEVSIGVAIGQPAFAGIAVSAKHIAEDSVPEIARRLSTAAERIAAAVHKNPTVRPGTP